ncbi:MAG: DUF6164 family protein [Lysobacteraceae bacterium]
MPQLLLNLRHVPDDEADEIRSLLDEHGVAWYETQPGRWGISFGGIWLKHDAELARARDLMNAYQRDRRAKALAEREEARENGRTTTVLSEFRRDPWRLLLAAAGILLMLGLIALPGWLLSR